MKFAHYKRIVSKRLFCVLLALSVFCFNCASACIVLRFWFRNLYSLPSRTTFFSLIKKIKFSPTQSCAASIRTPTVCSYFQKNCFISSQMCRTASNQSAVAWRLPKNWKLICRKKSEFFGAPASNVTRSVPSGRISTFDPSLIASRSELSSAL